jgi:hypothetical protein
MRDANPKINAKFTCRVPFLLDTSFHLTFLLFQVALLLSVRRSSKLLHTKLFILCKPLPCPPNPYILTFFLALSLDARELTAGAGS